MSFLKYVIFFGVLIFGVPIGCAIAKENEKFEKIMLFLTMFFTCRTAETINFVSRENYRGTARGFEIALVDLAVLVLLFLVIYRKDIYQIKIFPPGAFLFFLYFCFSAFSIANALEPLYSFFELWKMIRMYLYYWVFYNYLNEEKHFELILWFIGFIIIYSFMIVLQQKYMEGRFQCPGPFPHQNSLVMYMIVFGSIMFGCLLNRKGSQIETLFYLGTFGMASINIISTLSRAGLALYALGCVLILLASYSTKVDFKKIGITLLLILGAAAVLYKAMDSIVERFETAPENSANTRIELANAACAMADDYGNGIGLNNFSLRMVPPHKYCYFRREDSQEEGGIVETAYLLIAAETGWVNLVIFLIFIFRFYFKNFANYFRFKKTNLLAIPIGLFGGLTAIYIETALEWVLKQTSNFYQLMLVFAVIAAMHKVYKSGRLEDDDDEDVEEEELEEGSDFDIKNNNDFIVDNLKECSV